jgi:hypothetical protein
VEKMEKGKGIPYFKVIDHLVFEWNWARARHLKGYSFRIQLEERKLIVRCEMCTTTKKKNSCSFVDVQPAAERGSVLSSLSWNFPLHLDLLGKKLEISGHGAWWMFGSWC